MEDYKEITGDEVLYYGDLYIRMKDNSWGKQTPKDGNHRFTMPVLDKKLIKILERIFALEKL